ncbi:MAG: ABC transporter ATP-binding protein [Bifidobacteriaceae bacterium]|jgi:peptide/nickel transport system ATP-binding protein|nr:ABC transporter ATP-binding protein [Bifidobacteriaceae bacterium]
MTAILRIEHLSLGIPGEDGVTPILDDVSLAVEAGQVQGLAGESGSGKTITGLTVIGLEPAKSQVTGRIWLDGEDLLQITGSALNAIRGQRVGTVFQDPSTSLHPQLTIGAQLTDHVRYHLKVSKAEAADRAVAALDRVGVSGGAATLRRYPHEFSGGQRQRIAIAIALACEPAVLIADEPTTALDVTIQAGVLALIRSLVDSLGLAVLFITHDLGVMSAVADRVAVMRHGRIVENGPRHQVFTAPTNAYTRELLAALPGAPGGLQSRADLARMSLSGEDEQGDDPEDGAEAVGAAATGTARSDKHGASDADLDTKRGQDGEAP